jgi:tRNA threonylcarbamoyladenosine biosynthesis protein TsaE
MRLLSESPEQTQELGTMLGRVLDSGNVVALIGPLGAGKTVFAQGLARGLGVNADEYVSSPSFALVNQYRGRFPVFHIDTYRLHHEAEMVALGYEEYFDPDGVTIVEWANKVSTLLPDRHVLVNLKICDRTTREITIDLLGDWTVQTVSAIESAFERSGAEPA